jgi:protein CpxP
MRQRGFVAAIVAAVLVTSAAVVMTAQGPERPQGPSAGMRRGPGGPGAGGFGLPGLRQLDLSDAQKEQIRNIQQSHRDEVRQAAERTRTAERELTLAADAGVVDEGNIRAKANAFAAAVAESTILRAKINAEVFNLLTAEQQQKVKEFREQGEQRMKNRGERRQGQ